MQVGSVHNPPEHKAVDQTTACNGDVVRVRIPRSRAHTARTCRRAISNLLTTCLVVVAAFGLGGPASALRLDSFTWPALNSFEAPLSADVVDGFRPPEFRWLSGNRGLEYDSTSGEPVRAPVDGQVTFAGQVGGLLHISVRFDQQHRTTLSFLDSVDVSAGDVVMQGDVIGTAGPDLHLTVRDNTGSYVDPAPFFEPVDISIRLVPLDR